jgi:hypothetical protein
VESENVKAQSLFEHWVGTRHGCLGVADCSSVTWSWSAHQRKIDHNETVGIIQFENGDGTFDTSQLCGREGSVRFLAADACGHKAFRVLQFSFPILENVPTDLVPAESQPSPVASALQTPCDICLNAGGKGKAAAAITSMIFKWSGASGTTIAVSGAIVSSHALVTGGTVTIATAPSTSTLEVTVGGETLSLSTGLRLVRNHGTLASPSRLQEPS